MRREGVIEKILAAVGPLFRESGWLHIRGMDADGIKSEPVRLCAYKGREPVAVKGFVVEGIVAYTPEGVMTHTLGHGAATLEWGGMPLEDLRLVLAEARRAAREGLLD